MSKNKMNLTNRFSKFLIEFLTDLKYSELTKFEETVIQALIFIVFLLIIK